MADRGNAFFVIVLVLFADAGTEAIADVVIGELQVLAAATDLGIVVAAEDTARTDVEEDPDDYERG